MVRENQIPTKEIRSGRDDSEAFTHPAFGVISMSVVSGGSKKLFGSDIKHSERIRIEVKHATLERNLSKDWIYDKNLPIVEFEMSHAQFAEFITSPGRGVGASVTLTGIQGKKIASIGGDESKRDLFRREVEAAGRKGVESIIKKINDLGALIESGKTPKTELREIHASLSREAARLPNSVGFVIEQAQEAIEEAAVASKIDIEAFINHKINQLGVQAAHGLGIIQSDDRQPTIKGVSEHD